MRIVAYLAGALALLALLSLQPDSRKMDVFRPFSPAEIGSEFWKDVSRLEVVPYLGKIPTTFPGPLDTWAGGDKKELVFPLQENAVRFEFSVLDAHKTSPPAFSVDRGSGQREIVQVPKGSGDEGRVGPALIKFSFDLRHGARYVSVRSESGSWAILGDARVTYGGFNWSAAMWLLLAFAAMALVWEGYWRGWFPLLGGLVAPDRRRSGDFARRLARRSWGGLLFILVLAIPNHGGGVFDGMPLNTTVEVMALAVIFPFALLLNPAFLEHTLLRWLLVAAAALKITTLSFAVSPGVCLEPKVHLHQNHYRDDWTYEGIWNNGCFTASLPVVNQSKMPFEYGNTWKWSLPARVGFSFAVYPPSHSRFLILDFGPSGVLTELKVNGSSFSGQIGRGPMKVPIENRDFLTVQGEVSFTNVGVEWIFEPYFISADRYYQPGRSGGFYTGAISRPAQWASRALSTLTDLLLAAYLCVGLAMALSRLWVWRWSLLASIAGIAAVGTMTQSWIWDNRLHALALAALLPLLGRRLRSSHAMAVLFLLPLAFNAASFYDILGGFVKFPDGNDPLAYQMWARLILQSQDPLFLYTCPPPWNYPFIYWVAFLHVIGGQSPVLQFITEEWSIAVQGMVVYSLCRKWGMNFRWSWAAAVYFVWAVTITLNYVGAGLIETTANLFLFAAIAMIARYGHAAANPALLPIAGLFLFITVSMRLNFMPWAMLAPFAALSPASGAHLPLAAKECISKWKMIVPLVFSAVLFSALRKAHFALNCQQTSLINPSQNSYLILDAPLDIHLTSLWHVVSLASPDPQATSFLMQFNPLLRPFHSFFLAGWAVALGSLLFRRGALGNIPWVVSMFAWGVLVVHGLLINSLSGYGVRWGTPFAPIWTIAAFFALRALIQRLTGQTEHLTKN